MTSTTQTSDTGIAAWAAANRQTAARLLIVIGALFALIPAFIYWKSQAAWTPVAVWGGAVSLLSLFLGFWYAAGDSQVSPSGDASRILVIAFGGGFGMLTSLLGIWLLFTWGDAVKEWLRDGKRDQAWKVLTGIGVVLVGLAVMFVSVQVGLGRVRQSAAIRRLIFGYNAFLTGFLLALILVVANVLIAIKLPGAIDATESGMFTMSERSKQILAALDRPATIYLIMSKQDTILYDQARSLVDTAKEIAGNKLIVEHVEPEDLRDVARLDQRFPRKITDPQGGILVVHGEDKQEKAAFIPRTDLLSFDRSPMGGGDGAIKFQGESKLLAELMVLQETAKPVIYFTQGSGEPDLNESSPSKTNGLGILKSALATRYMDVKPLTFDPQKPDVPADATIVVIANPKLGMTPEIVNAIRDYFEKRSGKLIVLEEVPERGREWPESQGLTDFLQTCGVDVTRERVLSQSQAMLGNMPLTPETAIGILSREFVDGGSTLAQAFEGLKLLMPNARVVRPIVDRAGVKLKAEPLLVTPPNWGVWAEKDLKADALQMTEAMRRDPAQKKILSPTPLPLAVAVSEPPPPPSVMNPEPAKSSKPRLVCIGDATFVSNPFVHERAMPENFDFFASLVDWLREKPSNVGIVARDFKMFSLPPDANEGRLVLLPGVLALVGIVGLGAGVWVARRQ